MAERVPLCLVGCGGMGLRHVSGMEALERSGLGNVDLVAVCDIREENAVRAADEAERLLGRRPSVHLRIEDAVADPAVAAFDVVTEASTHGTVALPALADGKHVLCEKPLGITVRACQQLIAAAEASGAVLATAENYRRDPPNRLARAVLDAGLLGEVYLMIETRIGGDDRVIITPWRHVKERGAIGLDMGVHLSDIALYYFGEMSNVFGYGFIAEPVRYGRRDADPDQVLATGEDSVVAMYEMRSGVRVQLAYIPSGPGHRYVNRTVHGRLGSLEVFQDRSGRGPVLRRADGELAGRQLLAELPDFELGDLTARLFGADGVEYDLPFARADAGHLAIELHDFAEVIGSGRPPEVDGHGGLAAVAALLGAYESGLLGRPVELDELLTGAVAAYQREIDASLGLATAVLDP